MNKPVVLITGANGQLGQELSNFSQANYKLIPLTREQLDITNEDQCFNIMQYYKPDIVIHCAAYTAVDKAESEKDKAFLVNEQGTLNIVKATEALGSALVYISTDYVFDGISNSPYHITTKTDPQTVYGASKLAGEHVVQAHHSRYYIVRTSWVFGAYGQNFAKTMLSLAKQNKPISVVNDQTGSPTYTYDLAAFIYQLIATSDYGVYHACNAGECSWYQFAGYIFATAKLDIDLSPCTTAQFPRPAKRPAYSVLATQSLDENIQPLRHWHDAVEHFINQLKIK